MKKLLVLSNGVMLMLLLLSNTINNKKNAASTVFHDVKLGVDPELARDMVSNFKTDIWNVRQIDKKKYLDSRSVWFSLYKLKKFIKDIEDKTPLACRTDEFNLGIRIYFGDYPASQAKWNSYSDYTTEHQLPVEYKGLHSVVMVPTLWNSNDSFHYDFDPRRFNKDFICTPIPMSVVMDNLITQKKNNTGTAQRAALLPFVDTIPQKMAYMIMPDNLDNKRFFPIIANAGPAPGSGPAPDDFETTQFPADVNFANAGTLIPPPYPDGGTSGKAPVNSGDPNTSLMKTQSYGIQKFHVPYSGASFMRWVDGTNICGWNTIDLKKVTDVKTDNIKVQ